MKKKGIHPQDITLLPRGGGWLLVEFGGESKEEADDKAHRLMEHLKSVANPPSMKLFDDEAEEEHLWKVRESGLGATARIPGEKDAWEGWEDSAVPPDQVGDYLRDLRKLLTEVRLRLLALRPLRPGLHPYPDRLRSEDGRGVKHFRKFLNEAGDLVVAYGGSISGEHGDGQSKAALLPKMFGAGAGPGLRRVQGDLGPRQQDEPAQGGRPLLARREPPAGPALPPAPGRDAFPVPGRQGQLRLRDRALRRHRRVPQGAESAPCAPATW